jgi:hypothetical protein
VPLGARIAIGRRVLCRDAGLVGCLVMHAFGGICSKVGTGMCACIDTVFVC